MGSTHVIVWKRQTDLRLKQVTNLKNNLNIHIKSTQEKKSCICKSQITKKQKTNGAKDYRRGGGKSANKPLNKSILPLFYKRKSWWSPTFCVKAETYQGPPSICLKNWHGWQREQEKGWLSPCMYLGAAKPCVILMSFAFCNLTWEFKSCLSFASLMSAGSYISRKDKKNREPCWALVSSRCQMHLTSYNILGWVCLLQERKKRSFATALGISQQYFLRMKW